MHYETCIVLNLLIRRTLLIVPTLLIVAVFVFLLQRLLPGDPVLALAGEDRDPATLEAMRIQLGLDKPIPIQFLYWLGNVLRGDFGISYKTNQPVLELILQKLPVTLELASLALLIALAIGIPAGIISAYRKGTAIDYAANVLALSGLSIPNFWFGIILILVFAVKLKWLPASGYVSPWDDLALNLKTLIMPAFVLGNALAASIMRHTRSAMLGVLSQDYVRTARAKGLYEGRVVLRHAFRNALIPIVTVTTLLFGELMAGAVLTEQIFTIPGFGKLVVDAVFNRDYAVVQGVVLCTSIGFMAMNLLADLAYGLLNPRIRA